MKRPLELLIALRYLRAKRRNHFISFISFISILGIALAVVLLITVLSVMNGFQEELRERILVMTPHVTISGNKNKLSRWPDVRQRLLNQEHIVAIAPYVDGEAMLTQGGNVNAGLVHGIDPALDPQAEKIRENMKAGRLEELIPGKFGVILGSEFAYALGVWLGDKVTVITPQVNTSPAGILPRLKRFTVVGIFEIGMQEYDSATVLMHYQDAARLYRMKENVTGLSIKTDDLFNAPRVRYQLEQQLGSAYRVSDWTRRHANFFRAVQMEKMVMFVILSLIIAVASFNIVSTLVMVVTDKASDIAILRTLGLAPHRVMSVFMIQGTVIGLFGTLLGIAGGIALSSNLQGLVQFIEQQFNMRFLDPNIYYISEVPSKLVWVDVAGISTLTFVLSVLATLYPAWTAARTHPVEALRYE